MKKLSLLMLTLLILGCGTEKPVVEEPEPVIKKPPSTVKKHKPSHHPLIARGTVKHGEVNVDPELLNSEGLYFHFKQDFARYSFDLLERDGPNLPWQAIFTGRDDFPIVLRNTDPPFKYDTEYKLVMFFFDTDCESGHIEIQFRTKPQRPGVGRPAPVIQERPAVEALGERFRHEPPLPELVAGDVDWDEQNVDPGPLNANGIHFEFDEPIRKYKIDLRLEDGASLGWLPRGLVDNNMGERIHIMPAEGFPLLEFNTDYEIDIFVQNLWCWSLDFTIRFRTMPKP